MHFLIVDHKDPVAVCPALGWCECFRSSGGEVLFDFRRGAGPWVEPPSYGSKARDLVKIHSDGLSLWRIDHCVTALFCARRADMLLPDALIPDDERLIRYAGKIGPREHQFLRMSHLAGTR